MRFLIYFAGIVLVGLLSNAWNKHHANPRQKLLDSASDETSPSADTTAKATRLPALPTPIVEPRVRSSVELEADIVERFGTLAMVGGILSRGDVDFDPHIFMDEARIAEMRAKYYRDNAKLGLDVDAFPPQPYVEEAVDPWDIEDMGS